MECAAQMLALSSPLNREVTSLPLITNLPVCQFTSFSFEVTSLTIVYPTYSYEMSVRAIEVCCENFFSKKIYPNLLPSPMYDR